MGRIATTSSIVLLLAVAPWVAHGQDNQTVYRVVTSRAVPGQLIELIALYEERAALYESLGEEEEMVYWLTLSSELGNGIASYTLGRYYNRQRGEYRRTLRYRKLAKEQGYQPPPLPEQ